MEVHHQIRFGIVHHTLLILFLSSDLLSHSILQSSASRAGSMLNRKQHVELKDLTSEIILALHGSSLTGQIFMGEDEMGFWGHLDSERIHENFIPTVVFGRKKTFLDKESSKSSKYFPGNATVRSSMISSRLNSPNFVHVNVQILQRASTTARSNGRNRNNKWKKKLKEPDFDPYWKKLYSLTYPSPRDFLEEEDDSSSSSKISSSTTTTRTTPKSSSSFSVESVPFLSQRSKLFDFFLNFQVPYLHSRPLYYSKKREPRMIMMSNKKKSKNNKNSLGIFETSWSHLSSSTSSSSSSHHHHHYLERDIRSTVVDPSLKMPNNILSNLLPNNIIWIQMQINYNFKHNNFYNNNFHKDRERERELTIIPHIHNDNNININNINSNNNNNNNNNNKSQSVPVGEFQEDYENFHKNSQNITKKSKPTLEIIYSGEDVDEDEEEYVIFYLTCGEFCTFDGNYLRYYLKYNQTSKISTSSNNNMGESSNGEEYCDSIETNSTVDINNKISLNRKNSNSKIMPTACLLNKIASRMPFPVIFSPASSKLSIYGYGEGELESDMDDSVEIIKRNIMNGPNLMSGGKMFSDNYLGPFRGGTIYNQLVFIARKRFASLDSTLRPFTFLSWLMIVIVCSAAAVIFALIKILTMSNSDQSWYDYVVKQMLEIMHLDSGNNNNSNNNNNNSSSSSKRNRKKSFFQNESSSGSDNMSSSNIDIENDKDDSDDEDDMSKCNSLSSKDGGDRRSFINIERGKTSKTLLHGTIRIVSFVMVAIYEGKLYNTMTFPKNLFVSTFDELLTNDKYAVKISREAAGVDYLHLGGGGGSGSGLGPGAGVGTPWGFSGGSSSASSAYYSSSKNVSSIINRFSDSFNIEDCINWVEHSVAHGCIAFDFEFRNLPKAHKVRMLNEEKFFAKTKSSVLNFSFRHHKSSAAAAAILHPAAQISRWILEAGIFQFWMIAESFFTENLMPSKVTKRKVFNVDDYLGLFVVYVVLLFLAAVVFISEIGASWVRKKFEDRSAIELGIFIWEKIKSAIASIRVFCLDMKQFIVQRRKRWLKIKRIVVNNIV